MTKTIINVMSRDTMAMNYDTKSNLTQTNPFIISLPPRLKTGAQDDDSEDMDGEYNYPGEEIEHIPYRDKVCENIENEISEFEQNLNSDALITTFSNDDIHLCVSEYKNYRWQQWLLKYRVQKFQYQYNWQNQRRNKYYFEEWQEEKNKAKNETIDWFLEKRQ